MPYLYETPTSSDGIFLWGVHIDADRSDIMT